MNDGGVVFGAHVREYATLTNVLQACGAITPVNSIAEPVRYEAKPDASGVIEHNEAGPGGVVGAAFSGRAAFAIRIVGDALHPAARHGSFLVCDPDAPVVAGEMVLVEFADGTAAVRELVVARQTEVITASVLGGGRDTRPAADLVRLVPVVMVVSSSRGRDAR